MSRRIALIYESGARKELEESLLQRGYFGWRDLEEGDEVTRMEFTTGEVSLLLSNYDAYNVVSQVRNAIFEGIWLMGQLGVMADVIYLNFARVEATRDQLPIGREMGGMPSIGWKKGHREEGRVGGTFVIPVKERKAS